jgi:hypothetical protein
MPVKSAAGLSAAEAGQAQSAPPNRLAIPLRHMHHSPQKSGIATMGVGGEAAAGRHPNMIVKESKLHQDAEEAVSEHYVLVVSTLGFPKASHPRRQLIVFTIIQPKETVCQITVGMIVDVPFPDAPPALDQHFFASARDHSLVGRVR